MKNVRRFAWSIGFVSLLVVLTPVGVGRAQQDSPEALVHKAKLRLQPEETTDGGRVFSSASAPGMYVTRIRFEAGRHTRPHYHTEDRWVTVLEGTWWTGEGDVFDADRMIPIREGGLMYHPAGFRHYDGAKDEDVVVQIMGIGPVETIRTEIDASGIPVPR
ncbi:MAG: cupin domain-containing protein [Planctomycetota bacterium]|nr:cupin domain-containing protein [Planctomycetota bacterium]